MLKGTLLGQKSLSGSIGREVIATGGGVGGITEEELNNALETKVDKFDGSQETGDNRFTVYGQSLGEQKNIPYSSTAKEFALAQYVSGGNLIVAEPRNDTHATTKKYVDDNFVKSTSEARKIYGTDENGSSAEYNLVSNTYTANSIVQRSETGTIHTADPQWGNEATNKRYVDNKFNGANKAVSFVNYSAMITSLNDLGNTSYSVGQNIMIVTLAVPDLWVSEIAETSVAYTYVSDDDFVNELNTNGSVQVGYYKLSALETQKVDLAEYAKLVDLDAKVSQVEYSKDQTFADGSDAGVIGRLYMRFRDNTENSIVANCQNGRYTVPVRDSTGNFYVGNPTQQYHTMNLISVTAKQGTEAPTEDTKALYVGQLYYDTTNNKMYMCFGIDTTNKKYTWTQIIRVTDYAGNSVKGVVDVRSAFGLNVDQYGRIQTVLADETTIANKTDVYKPIVSNKIDYAVKQGLAYSKLEGTGFAWTDEEKASARALLGIDELITGALEAEY